MEPEEGYLERVMLENTLRYIRRKELAYIIPAVAEGHLCQVVCSKRKEVGVFGNLNPKTPETASDISIHIVFN